MFPSEALLCALFAALVPACRPHTLCHSSALALTGSQQHQNHPNNASKPHRCPGKGDKANLSSRSWTFFLSVLSMICVVFIHCVLCQEAALLGLVSLGFSQHTSECIVVYLVSCLGFDSCLLSQCARGRGRRSRGPLLHCQPSEYRSI